MGACSQARLVHSIFIPCVPAHRTHLTVVYEIRLTASPADNLMNNGSLRRVLSGHSRRKCRLFPLVRNFRAQQRKNMITPRLSQTRAQQRKTRITPCLLEASGAQQRKTRITPRLSQTSGAQQRKNMDYAPLVANFRGSTEKNRITPCLLKLSGAQQRKTDYAPLVGNFLRSTEKNVNYRAFRNVSYNKRRDAHCGRMFRLLWTFVDFETAIRNEPRSAQDCQQRTLILFHIAAFAASRHK